jgi:hypothetical protein
MARSVSLRKAEPDELQDATERSVGEQEGHRRMFASLECTRQSPLRTRTLGTSHATAG